MLKTNINYRDRDLSLTWNNHAELRKWARMQMGEVNFPPTMSETEFENQFSRRVKYNWDRISANIDFFEVKKIVDVGCGVATPDLLASKLNPTAEFYLVDKSEFTRATNKVYYQDVHGHYNSWDVVNDCISNSGIDSSKIHFLDPSSLWPESVDAVISTFSWCWHYPKEVYWDKVMASLKVGGILSLDILYLKDRDVVAEISEDMNSEPISLIKNKATPHLKYFEDQLHIVGDAYGGFYTWVRQK